MLWDVPEKNLQDGEIVKVYVKSNISHVYVIGVPGTKENIEVPLWQISTPRPKKKALALKERYAEYQHQYAKIKIDGLPVRDGTVNTARQVYRLHKDEVVKILYKGQGQDVYVGKNEKLEGDWLCVLTQGGTEGWCFSYNLTKFETGAGGEIVSSEADEDENVSLEDSLIDQILQAKWYPEYYSKMLRDNMIDLEQMKSSFGFDTGYESGKVVMNVKDRYRTADYNGTTRVRDGVYDFNDTPFQLVIRNPNQISINYSAPGGKLETYNFVTISNDYDITQVIGDERIRRNELLQKLYNVSSFTSSSYGTLVFSNGNTFTWNNFKRLVPSVIPSGSKNHGTVNIKYLIDKNSAQRFDGILTFVFEGESDEEVNFFYKLTSEGLSMEDADNADIKDNVAFPRTGSSFVIYFGR